MAEAENKSQVGERLKTMVRFMGFMAILGLGVYAYSLWDSSQIHSVAEFCARNLPKGADPLQLNRLVLSLCEPPKQAGVLMSWQNRFWQDVTLPPPVPIGHPVILEKPHAATDYVPAVAVTAGAITVATFFGYQIYRRFNPVVPQAELSEAEERNAKLAAEKEHQAEYFHGEIEKTRRVAQNVKEELRARDRND